MKPDVRYSFDVKFEEQLERALKGYAPWKDHKSVPKGAKWRSDPISDGQRGMLKSLGVTKFPLTKGEASDLISRMKEKA